ncbi:MAG: 50S ribosomal protein L25 [Parcubacteria group bacterium GW2011_GWE2_39_37]|uniref:Large ribosomal subunit protein bL25 n=1 Tax=Candidatus Falkowbacteria bacterium GW2011_GWF2_39_8 TaxID=1618642 RepID=A0A0G0SFB8_9BACT|nr:MAG: 50S ribosomal protein L25 [Parcubacteria group bacterium GW2011_GWE2_39_37]KKR33400.1 MAG: 50S ribosomal protein L25 [Candidatus Falkowbacteria bacterium GW2011_GWF2_39_8]
MSEKIELQAQSRDAKKEKVNTVRAEGFIPAVIYGTGLPSLSIKVKESDFGKVFTKAGETNLIELTVDGKTERVLIYDVSKNPIKRKIESIDFIRVDMKKKITVEVPLVFVGEARAVKDLGGFLVRNADHVEVECLPEDLINQIEVDVSLLKEIEDSVKMSDLKLPAGVELTSVSDEVLAIVIKQEVEAEEPVATAETPAEPEKEKEAAK